MATEKLTKEQVKDNIETKLSRYFGCTPDEASKDQMYKAVSMTVRDMLTSKRNDFKHECGVKQSKAPPFCVCICRGVVKKEYNVKKCEKNNLRECP